MMLLTAFLWGLSFISQSKGVENLSPIAFNGIRSILGGIVLLPVIFFFRPKEKISKDLILGGVVCCILFLRKYLGKIQKAPKKENNGKPGFGAHATTAMFVGLCAAYIGSYIGKVIPRDGQDVMPLFVAVVAALVMAVFEYFIQKKGKAALENFSLAASMLVAMAAAVLLQMVM